MCTCGKPKADGVPCRHMVVITMSLKVEGLTRIHIIMPYWWTTAHLQAQFAMDVYCLTDISLKQRRRDVLMRIIVKRVWLITSRNCHRKSEAGGQSSTVESVTDLNTTWLTVFSTLQINRVHGRRRRISLVRTVRKARCERLLKVHRGALYKFYGV